MRIHIGGDHAAYELQQALIAHLEGAGHEVVNHGPFGYDEQDDYPGVRAARRGGRGCRIRLSWCGARRIRER